MFKYLTGYTGEGDWSVISISRFITLLEDRCYLVSAPLCWKFTRLDETLKITRMIGAISSRNSFSKSGLSLSRPAAFLGFKFCKRFRIPDTEIPKSSMIGVEFSDPDWSASGFILPQSVISCNKNQK